MQPVEARRSERIHYQCTVELRPEQGLAEFDSVRAEALDLGPGGMRIAAPVRMPVGAYVTCRLELAGGQLSLPGRVAWQSRADADPGMGICFERLGEHESGLLRDTVESARAGHRTVELSFAGLEQPIRARARASTKGLHLSATLPILARGTELSFRLDEEGPLLTGRIAEAWLHDERGGRRLEVEVEVLDRDSVRFRRPARYGYAEEIEAEESRGAPALPFYQRARTSSSASVEAPVARPAARARPMLLAATLGAALGWSATQVTTSDSPAARPGTQRAQSAHVPGSRLLSHLVQDRERGSPGSGQATAGAAAPSRESSTMSRQVAAQLRPEIRVSGEITRVLIPFEGSLQQMRSRLWAAPLSLAIDLPNGRALLGRARYLLTSGGVSELRVAAHDSGQRLRLELDAPPVRYSVAAQDGILELRLVRRP